MSPYGPGKRGTQRGIWTRPPLEFNYLNCLIVMKNTDGI